MLFVLLCITTLDGSQINLKVAESTTLEYVTTYGELRIPIKDVRDCQLGVHPADKQAIMGHIQNLGSDQYAQREAASKYLKLHLHDAQHELAKVTDANPERSKRAAILLKELFSPEPANDLLTTNDGTITGFIANKALVGESESLGKLTVPISVIKSIRIRTTDKTIKIGASTNWTSVGFLSSETLTLVAEGTIDLWPTELGVYVTDADGSKAGNINGNYPIGALIGRIQGREFLIGKNFSANVGRGELELRVIPTSWSGGVPPAGYYEVKIK